MAFEIASESYNAWVARFKDVGIEVFETRFESVQAKSVFIKDPEGNSVELICSEPPNIL